ncbi:hypothetical protein QAD02_019506 [Eretmocerus hayati]|uniref:Uncharacterized protein n=1 Tax=Eretmocerus hayati TaxID=131215 RepID=A0ACC2PK89_9HYME|nr:hypothetical protein QAD02_019506 [Eretmocerus hayati]
MNFLISVIVIGCSFATNLAQSPIETIFQWEYIDYDWPSQAEREEALRNGSYDPIKVIPNDVDVSQDGRIFITLKFDEATPARLGYVTIFDDSIGALIRPYPSWSWYQTQDCDSILAPVRMVTDKCNRLWTVDSGFRPTNPDQCNPKIIAFDLTTNTLIEKIVIPDDIAKGSSAKYVSISNIKIEESGEDCENPTIYMNDVASNSLIIWRENQLFRLENSRFRQLPKKTNNANARSASNWISLFDAEIIADEDERLENTSGMKIKIDPFTGDEQLWILTYRPQSFSANKVRIDEMKYYILRASVEELVSNSTKCRRPSMMGRIV